MEANFFNNNKLIRKEIIIVVFCLLIGFTLRFYAFDKKSLWMDEIYTFNDSKDSIKNQLNYYKENPTYLHPPLFFILTHQFYPFTKPERDLRIIPLIFGTLSIPMIYFLTKLFSSAIALPCTLSLAFMAYHISLSQDGRSYSLLMFLGMCAVYFFMKYLNTKNKRYLLVVALFFALLFYTSYSSIPFIVFSQILWFYQIDKKRKLPLISSFIFLNIMVFLLCLPWVSFLAFHYRGQLPLDLQNLLSPSSFWNMMYGIFHDWMPYAPLMITSMIFFFLHPFFSMEKRNAFILFWVFILPVAGLYFFCRLFNITHFITSRYFITFLPLFLIALLLSLHSMEMKFKAINNFLRLKYLFLILLIASNLLILPFYYRSEKQDYRSLVNYLKNHLQDGDKIIVGNPLYIAVMLHYFGVFPRGRHHVLPAWRVSQYEIENRVTLKYQNITFNIIFSKSHWFNYFNNGSRLWIAADKHNAKMIMEKFPCILKGYFDGSFLNFDRFPTDASIYLLLWDPNAPSQKALEVPIDSL